MDNDAGKDVNHFDRFCAFMQKVSSDIYPEPATALHSDITTAMLLSILEQTTLSTDARILDVGCGQGPALDKLSELGFRPEGITLGEEDARICVQKGHEVRIMDQSFLEFDDDTFDLVWARHSLEHSVAPFLTLSEIHRVTKRGGWLYVEVPAPDTICHHERNENHFSVLPKCSWSALIERSGFAICQQRTLSLELESGNDEYWAFLCQKAIAGRAKPAGDRSQKPVYLGLSVGENFGWGVCSKHLAKEIALRVPLISIQRTDADTTVHEVPGPALTGIATFDFEPIVPMKGSKTFAYTFFEYNLQPAGLMNARKYDRIFCGSTWCKEKLVQAGLVNTDVVLQGVDQALFSPVAPRSPDGMFIVFSGGKFEYRKGQDLVLRAIKVLQEKYKDIVLMNAWYNAWPDSLAYMTTSPHITFEIQGKNWGEQMLSTYKRNGLDHNRIVTLPLMDHNTMRPIFAKTDLGLFPNRCEGGTNLVLMEYMACGKPVVASWSSGHRDVVNERNALLLKELKPLPVFKGHMRVADWDEPSLEEIIAAVEYAYQHRDHMLRLGLQAGKDMKKLTWGSTADQVLQLMGMGTP